ncbi:MAG: hypothetical protein KH452_05930 [Clostridiales bacterium]|nr:hypothetical protein [Clostridiales bacterium]
MAVKKRAEEPQGTAAFTKEQLMNSDRYEGQKDLIDALLPDGKTITISEMDEKIMAFKKGKVKK